MNETPRVSSWGPRLTRTRAFTTSGCLSLRMRLNSALIAPLDRPLLVSITRLWLDITLLQVSVSELVPSSTSTTDSIKGNCKCSSRSRRSVTTAVILRLLPLPVTIVTWFPVPSIQSLKKMTLSSSSLLLFRFPRNEGNQKKHWVGQ